MGCSTCNQKKESVGSIDFIPQDFTNSSLDQNFLLKVVVFIVLIFALPLIILVLVLQIFLHFFTPKSVKNINNKARSFFTKIFEKLTMLRYKKEITKRAKQFKENRDYEVNSELVDIEVFEKEDNNEEEEK